MTDKYVIGLDYGTDSVRAVVVNTANGETAGTSVFEYPRWKQGLYCDPASNRFRQHPLDYIEGMETTVREALKGLPREIIDNIAGITVDTTGSTPVAVDRQGVPLSLKPGFEDDPDAMFVLWKDHTAIKEAAEINEVSKTWGGTDFTMYSGGVYSSEWFWAKILHVLRSSEKIRENAFSWVEHCDWIPALLTGNTDPLKLKRSRCAAGHKAMWHKDFNGLPSEEFLVRVDPLLSGLRDRLFTETYTCDVSAGVISEEWSRRLGLPSGVKIGAGAFDAHLGAIGGEIKPYHLVKVMGTSTCDMLVAHMSEAGDRLVAGICGQVDGSIIPGMLGLEAGQSAFGDVYAWFGKLLLWPVEEIISTMSWLDENSRERIREETSERIIAELTREAEQLPDDETALVALDWLNGRRTPFASQELKGAIAGLSLGSDAPRIFKSLVEATAFGSKMINDRFIEEGVRIDGVIAIGGVARKNPWVMQIVTDVLNMPISVASSDQTCALGSAMAASVMAGIHPDFESAREAMGGGFEKEYRPDPAKARKYDELYLRYKKLGAFIEHELT
ncbi:MAG TPA: ribulokinase [Bacteroidales bacterium]|nr:ribulokinase [Bacteroidales bacterium]HNY53202.1 ribulokinase [Bacteroidales bacterium]HOG57133.1 ribulokinase [Bacteroidales bacterium]HPX44254.1 ribulokinase [Bacteroidales bacterium]HQB86610.1 ribulokinase [Bacteroidales bacterium]